MNRGTVCRTRRWSWLIGATAALASVIPSGCDSEGNPLVMSLDPFYSQVDLETDSRLSGTWSDKEGEVIFLFEQAEEKGTENEYKLVVKEKEGEREASGEFDVRIVRLGGFRFLNIYPRSNTGGNEFYRAHFVRAHTLARTEIREDSLQLAFLSAGWLRAKIEGKSVETPYVRAGDALVLTGKTEELQELVFRYASDDEAFANPLSLERQRLEEGAQ